MDYVVALGKEILISQAKIEIGEELDYAYRTDKHLVDQALAGEERAFECIFEKHKRRIAILAGRFFRNSAEVEEIVQITFTKAFVELKSFRGAHDFSLASWLNRIATNTCLNNLKSRQTKLGNLITEVTANELDVFAADLKETDVEELLVQRDLFEKLLGSLNPEDRVILQMIYAQDMTVSDVAAVLGWSRAKVNIRAFRARRYLARLVKKFL